MSNTAVVVVCLPKATSTDQLVTTAIARLASSSPLANASPAGRFPVVTRLRRGSLVQPWHDTAAGGPVRLLDLDALRVSARNAYWYRWHIWQQVAAGTRPARPYWHFAERHRDEPAKYGLDKAQRQYLAQPRVAATRTYNALPNKIQPLFPFGWGLRIGAGKGSTVTGRGTGRRPRWWPAGARPDWAKLIADADHALATGDQGKALALLNRVPR